MMDDPCHGQTCWPPKGPRLDDVVTRTIDVGANADRLPAGFVVAAGAGIQRLYVMPLHRMTVARQAAIPPDTLYVTAFTEHQLLNASMMRLRPRSIGVR
ncbi:hypothetical protein [Sphingomonas lenta]|uniref:hypothetical protein n=1 Tax=Sphingomonas lenta TaxID=1141887 RepID=UPI001140E12C|nr:hypothetical protein [Sphingomonas lenta]